MVFALYVSALGFALFALVTALVWRFSATEGGLAAFISATVTVSFLALCLILALLAHSIS